MKTFRKIGVLLQLNVKLFFSNKLALSVLAAVSLAFVIISGSLVKEYDKKASLPIGVIDKDQSALSSQVLEELYQIDGFTVHEWDEDKLQKALEKETIYAYFVIGEGFEQKIKDDQTRGIVSMHYLADYNFVSILSDIFAKSMMKEVVLYRGNKLYDQYLAKYGLTRPVEYVPYINGISGQETQGIFETTYYKVTDGSLTQSVETKNAVLSNQIFVGMMAVFGSFLAMFFVMCLRKSKLMKSRMRLSMISCWLQEVADMVTLLLAESIFGVLASFYMCKLLQIDLKKEGFHVFCSLLLFMAILSLVFGIVSKMLEKETIYQFLCVLFIFLIGGISIMASIGQINMPVLSKIAKNIPNYWFITDITDIILAGKTTIRLFPVGVLAGLAFIYTSITDIKLKVFAR